MQFNFFPVWIYTQSNITIITFCTWLHHNINHEHSISNLTQYIKTITCYHFSAKVRKPWQSGKYTVYLWEFLYGLLQDPECISLITWTNKESREFRINNAQEIATLWGTVKNRPTMNDKKLLRALRYYYKTKILRKVRRKYN
jgi:hypothetical protein